MKVLDVFVFLLLSVIVIGACAPVGLCADFPTLEVIPNSVTVGVGELFTVDIVISDVVDLFIWQVTLWFNASVVRCTGVHLPSPPIIPIPIPPDGFTYMINNDVGRIIASWMAPSHWPSFSGTGILFHANFEALNVGTSNLQFDHVDTFLMNSNGEEIPLPESNIFDGQVTVLEVTHDIAVVDAEPFHGITFEGMPFKVYVNVSNFGTVTESFNVTVYANDTSLGTLTSILLASGCSTSMTFTVDSLGLPRGDYTITAYAWPVQGETNTTNNRFVNGKIAVTIVGDVDNNGKVELKDIFLIAKAYGSSEGDPRYNSNLDLNCDGKIDLLDYYSACKNFGKAA